MYSVCHCIKQLWQISRLNGLENDTFKTIQALTTTISSYVSDFEFWFRMFKIYPSDHL